MTEQQQADKLAEAWLEVDCGELAKLLKAASPARGPVFKLQPTLAEVLPAEVLGAAADVLGVKPTGAALAEVLPSAEGLRNSTDRRLRPVLAGLPRHLRRRALTDAGWTVGALAKNDAEAPRWDRTLARALGEALPVLPAARVRALWHVLSPHVARW